MRAFVKLSGLPRTIILGLAVGVGCFWIALLSIVLSKGSHSAALLLDYSVYSVFPHPLTIQNVMYLFFFLCLGDLFVRWTTAPRKLAYLYQGYLPEDDQSVLQAHGPIREKVSGHYDGENGFLPYLMIIPGRLGRSSIWRNPGIASKASPNLSKLSASSRAL